MIGIDLMAASSAPEMPGPRVRRLANAGAWIGAVVGAIGLAWAWRAHRVWGGVLGFFLVGPIVGGAAGSGLALATPSASADDRPALPSAGGLHIGDKVREEPDMGLHKGPGTVIAIDANGRVTVQYSDGLSAGPAAGFVRV